MDEELQEDLAPTPSLHSLAHAVPPSVSPQGEAVNQIQSANVHDPHTGDPPPPRLTSVVDKLSF